MKTVVITLLAVLNLGEGIIHLVTAAISFWGMCSIGVWDWRVATAPTVDVALGLASLFTGVVLGIWKTQRNPEPETPMMIAAGT